MFGRRFVDRTPVVFQPRVAPEPELQERLEEKIRNVASELSRTPRHYSWPDYEWPAGKHRES